MNFNHKLIESWWALLRHLSAEMKLELASRLINSLKTPDSRQKDIEKNVDHADFQNFILNGPIMSEDQYQQFLDARKDFNLWRTN